MDKSDREKFLPVEKHTYRMRNQFRRTRNIFAGREIFLPVENVSVGRGFFVSIENAKIRNGSRTPDWA